MTPYVGERSFFETLEPRRLLTGNGLLGEYFTDPNLTTEKFWRTDPNIDFNFGTSSPLPSQLAADGFSVKWTGQIQAPVTGTYTFRTVADDGVRLTVRGQQIINRWSQRIIPGDADLNGVVNFDDYVRIDNGFTNNLTGWANGDFDGNGQVNFDDYVLIDQSFNNPTIGQSDSGQVSLTAGQRVDIELDYFDQVGPGAVQLLWTPPGGSEQVVPRSALFDAFSGGPQTFTNPIDPNGADPWVTQWQGDYLYARSDGGRVYVQRSSRLQDIDNVTMQTVWAPPPGHAYSQDVWAPELHYLNGKWYIYVAADDGDNATHRMYVLEGTSQNPQAPYVLKGQLMPTTDRWAIDGTVMTLSGQNYFVWSGWPGLTDGQQNLYIARMSNPWTISGDRALISSPTFSWEQQGLKINEGPEALQHNGHTYLIYSASGYWTNSYCLGQLTYTGGDPMLAGSWVKKSTPVFSQGNNVVGVGHASFTKSPDGLEDWIVYHAHNTPGNFTGIRDIHVQPFTWNADGSPNLGQPVANGTPVSEPGGTPHFVTALAPRGASSTDDRFALRLVDLVDANWHRGDAALFVDQYLR
jgi:GH43 family beta-xylosidase